MTALMSSRTEDRPVKVTVLVVTYNHADLIRQALDSALRQKTDFDFEILISEDCSTDGTRAIVQEYQQAHPDSVRLILSETNLRSNAVVTRGFRASRGEYIALLDGDDYWTSEEKLQRQADFLDARPECSMCFHDACTVDGSGRTVTPSWTRARLRRDLTRDDIWRSNPIATCSAMFRRSLVRTVPDWYHAFFPITDWPLYILMAESGSIGYVDGIMGAYRLHGGGLYSALSEDHKLLSTFAFYHRMNLSLDFREQRRAMTGLATYFFDWCLEYLRRGDLGRARMCFRFALSGHFLNDRMSLRKLAHLFARLYLRR
jgi:glycosyltransferase involved in cell wall biosynthesis